MKCLFGGGGEILAFFKRVKMAVSFREGNNKSYFFPNYFPHVGGLWGKAFGHFWVILFYQLDGVQ